MATLKLTELRQIATAQGLKGTSALRKGDLIAAIETAGGRPSASRGATSTPRTESAATGSVDSSDSDAEGILQRADHGAA